MLDGVNERSLLRQSLTRLSGVGDVQNGAPREANREFRPVSTKTATAV